MVHIEGRNFAEVCMRPETFDAERGMHLLGCRVDVLDKWKLLDDPLPHLQQQPSQPG